MLAIHRTFAVVKVTSLVFLVMCGLIILLAICHRPYVNFWQAFLLAPCKFPDSNPSTHSSEIIRAVFIFWLIKVGVSSARLAMSMTPPMSLYVQSRLSLPTLCVANRNTLSGVVPSEFKGNFQAIRSVAPPPVGYHNRPSAICQILTLEDSRSRRCH